mgnify:CR=1 FL=1
MQLTRFLGAVFFGAALVATPAALRAQAVVGTRNLTFGTVVPGVPTIVAPSDAVRSGQFQITGAVFRNVTISFTLPTVMNRIGIPAATMPISFLNNSALITGLFASAQPFDPNTPQTFFLWFGAYQIALGGRVAPSPTQLGGSYSANVVITVIFL